MSRAIGVFDSGLGGLTAVRAIIKALPNENIIYLGDTARVPYGPRSKETVTKNRKELRKNRKKTEKKSCFVESIPFTTKERE